VVAQALLVVTASPAYTQTARSGGGANAQLLQQMQQLASERTSLEAETARTKKELEDLRKERDDLKKAQQVAEQRSKTTAAALSQSTGQRAATEQELTQTKARMQELVAKFRETLQSLREFESQAATAKQTLAMRDRQLKACTEYNDGLYKLNSEILTKWEHESSWSRLGRADPFTKIGRVRLDNMADDYKARADDLRVNPVTAPSVVPAAPRPAEPAPAPVVPQEGSGR
jgi:chromosome segregation ATPase